MTAIWRLSTVRRPEKVPPCLHAVLGDMVSKMPDAVHVQGWSDMTLEIASGSEMLGEMSLPGEKRNRSSLGRPSYRAARLPEMPAVEDAILAFRSIHTRLAFTAIRTAIVRSRAFQVGR